MWNLSLLFALIGASYAAEVCFDELGCFDDMPPWGGTDQRPVPILPWKPEDIGTRFLLFTQKNRYYQEIKADKSIGASNYSGGLRKTKFVIPGYLMRGDEDWPQEMCKIMVKWENVNCVAVEWKTGVQTQYGQAVNNARVVAAQVASMISFLMGYYKQKSDKFHLIGHSVGAHVAGDAGSRIPGLARITGLDPVEPYFQDTNAAVYLDTSDAAFVDIIHTDGASFDSKLGLGMSQAMGHIDFYPNGGELMPGCTANRGSPTDLDAIWDGTRKFDACNHMRAYEYYMESIVKASGFVAYPCSDKDTFADGKCFPCADNTCPMMGHSADKFTVTDGISKTKYFLNTGASSPYNTYSYNAKVTLNGPVWSNLGYLYVSLVGNGEETKEYQLHVGVMTPGKVYEVQIAAEVDVGDVSEVKFRWNNHIYNPMKPRYGASHVDLMRGKDKKTFTFCGSDRVAENAIQTVALCTV